AVARRGAAQSRHRAAAGRRNGARRRRVPQSTRRAGRAEGEGRRQEAARGSAGDAMTRRKATAECAETAEQKPLVIIFCALCVLCGCFSACRRDAPQPVRARAHNLLLITIDTLRADHVGAYGYTRARTPTLDALAASGARFDRAYAPAPITLPSHATLLTGRYPLGHSARDNGMPVSATVPTLATELHDRRFKTAAFVAAFPLDHQFGLNRGFDVYGDNLPRQPDGQPANERPADAVVSDAIAWLHQLNPQSPTNPPSAISNQQFFLWVHLLDPHAPYGDPSSQRPVPDRYDEESATADRAVGRLLDALGPARAGTLVVAAADHGEAFGEHGEYAHSIFIYDTTLRVPLIV